MYVDVLFHDESMFSGTFTLDERPRGILLCAFAGVTPLVQRPVDGYDLTKSEPTEEGDEGVNTMLALRIRYEKYLSQWLERVVCFSPNINVSGPHADVHSSLSFVFVMVGGFEAPTPFADNGEEKVYSSFFLNVTSPILSRTVILDFPLRRLTEGELPDCFGFAIEDCFLL